MIFASAHFSHSSKKPCESMPFSKGFTLLEMVFVLAMIAMMTVWITLKVSTVDTEKQLRNASGNIEMMIRRARALAVTQQRPYQVTLSVHGIDLAPEFSLGDDRVDDAFEDDFTDSDDSSDRKNTFKEVTDHEDLEREVEYEIRRWQSDEWITVEGDVKLVFILEPNGLVEPISIRVKTGESWLIQELHPLTGGVKDEELYIEGDA